MEQKGGNEGSFAKTGSSVKGLYCNRGQGREGLSSNPVQ